MLNPYSRILEAQTRESVTEQIGDKGIPTDIFPANTNSGLSDVIEDRFSKSRVIICASLSATMSCPKTLRDTIGPGGAGNTKICKRLDVSNGGEKDRDIPYSRRKRSQVSHSCWVGTSRALPRIHLPGGPGGQLGVFHLLSANKETNMAEPPNAARGRDVVAGKWERSMDGMTWRDCSRRIITGKRDRELRKEGKKSECSGLYKPKVGEVLSWAPGQSVPCW